MLRAIIIDDEQNGIDSLNLLIKSYVSDVRVVAYTSEAISAAKLIDDYGPEIVFLDINMPNLNGFDVLNNVTYKDFSLVFTTAHEEYALKAIKNSASDYLLKPIDIEDLNKALEKIRLTQEKRVSLSINALYKELNFSKTRLVINTKEDVRYLNPEDIIRAEAESNYSLIVSITKERFLIGKTLKEVQAILAPDRQFMRVHQSHLINLKHVVKFYPKKSAVIEMIDGTMIPVSRQKKRDFIRWLEI